MILNASILVAIVGLSAVASANPGPPETLWYSSPAEALSTIFFYNLPINLLWFSLVLGALCWMFGRRVGDIPVRTLAFIGAVFAVALVVTGLGAAIDYTLLLAEYPFGYVLYYDPVNWAAALALIFASIYLSSLLLLNLDPKVSLIPAAAIAAMNLIWWSVAIDAGSSFALLTMLLSLVLVPFSLAILARWHLRNLPWDSLV